MTDKKTYTWLSFVDDERPRGQRNVGVCIVEAPNLLEAVAISHALGINPGGEVASYTFEEGDPAHGQMVADGTFEFCLNQLRQKEELLTLEAAFTDGYGNDIPARGDSA